MEESEERYILSLDWFKKWESYTSSDGEPYCGKISNSTIIERDMLKTGTERVVLKKHLQIGKDFITLPKALWTLLLKNYGLEDIALKH